MWFVLRFLFVTFEAVAGWIFWLLNRNRSKGHLPAVDDPIVLESATSLAEKIRRREVTAERVVSACIARSKQVHAFLNCLAVTQFDEALNEAKAVDAFLASTSKPEEEIQRDTPFLGVPFTCKESLAVAGLEHSSGFIPCKGRLAEADADSVQHMKQSGAILMATTIVPELAFWWETVSPIRGVAKNPFDFRRSPGGSSGGEGALVTAAGSPLGIATDFYGSIRMPAHMCGIFGHKPTGSLVPSGGHFPDGGPRVEGTFVVGPVARTVADLEVAMSVLGDKQKLGQLKPVEIPLTDLKVYYMQNDCGGLLSSTVDGEIEQLLLTLVTRLDSDGARVEKVFIPEVRLAAWLFLFEAMRRGGKDDSLRHRLNYPNEGPVNPFMEAFRFLTGRSLHVFPLILSAIVEHFVMLAMRTPIKGYIFKQLDAVRKKFEDLLEGDDNAVFIYPTLPHAALFHNQPCVVPFNASYTGLFSILELPVTQVPLGMTKDGLPIGVQVAGGKNRDWLTLAVAEKAEGLFGGWKPPFPVVNKEWLAMTDDFGPTKTKNGGVPRGKWASNGSLADCQREESKKIQ